MESSSKSEILCITQLLKVGFGEFHRGAAETNPTRDHEDAGSIPQWVKDLALP